MSPDRSDRVLNTLIADFGTNYTFALDLLDQYRSDRESVDVGWRDYFDRIENRLGVASSGSALSVPATPSPAETAAAITSGRPAETAMVRAESRAPAAPGSLAVASPTILPGDIIEPIRGGSLRLAENMQASLQMPTATSVRSVPVRILEENRRILNRRREVTGGDKISYTHLLAWALLRALETFPRLNDAFTEVDGQAHRIQRDAVRLGIAVDVQRKDGTRALLVPNIKDAQRLDFCAFVAAVDGLITRTRRGAISPDDFLGTTVSLTNPGTLGTTSSAPRLMPGQGLLLAIGALDFPPEYRSMSARTLSLLGISKVMTVTCTYDHRIIQGAESGLFLARLEELLRGEEGFYERIFADLKLPHRPIRWEIDVTPGWQGLAGGEEAIEKQARVLQLIHAYRVRGHLVADLDPLDAKRTPHPDLDPATYGLTLWDLDREFITNGLSGKQRATLREILEVLRDTYCGSIGVEFMYIADPERKEWLQNRMESTRNYPALDAGSRLRILDKLIESECFERHLHARYVGHKRFSLEGCEALIAFLDRTLNDAAQQGVREVVIGMSHRGRLNVLATTVGKPLAQIFATFEGNLDPASFHGSGDVKYHLGSTGTHLAPTGEALTVTVAPNPSHLESVDPVVVGMVRAKQDASGDRGRSHVIPILIHGDAAFAGQGVVAETLNLAELDGYTVGGTIHVVVNNQIGFTTLPRDARSSTYCTDVAKMVHAPAFHVNGDDPEGVDHVAGLAFEYRQRFKRDVVIDIVGYRRWGHNESDEPSYTQPLMYAEIRDHPSVARLFGEQCVRNGIQTRAELDAVWEKKKAALMREGEQGAFAKIARRAAEIPPPVDPVEMRGRLKAVLRALSTVPAGFELHPKLALFLRSRAELIEGQDRKVDWATAEALAFGTLLLEGVPVRLSGQDSGRGTFSQRHAVLYDVKTAAAHVPLNGVATKSARFEVHDSLLSEAGVLGFEFGYAVAEHRALVLWEAQFGDFGNAAQIIIDQFIASAEQKWGQPVGLVLLLPHGYEGQGPEHSSARIERFLTLCAEDNLRVCYPSTPASFFHLLRRQARDVIEKPLVVFTPKSLLRHPRCVSTIEELATSSFEPVLDDPAADPARVKRVVLHTGKLHYDLVQARELKRVVDLALIRLEQIYPFPAESLTNVMARYPATAELVWAQEEPRNMGAWRFVRERFLEGSVPGTGLRVLRYLGRPESASPASGSLKIHQREQESLLQTAIGGLSVTS